jgi:DNA invertase Pin-like site-specific DNA recombinase
LWPAPRLRFVSTAHLRTWQERTLISQRTKSALAAAKVRGVKLGNPNLDAIRGSGGEAGKAEAERFAGTVLPIIKPVSKAGATTLQAITDALNDRGVATARGGSWYRAMCGTCWREARDDARCPVPEWRGLRGAAGGYRADFENRQKR